MDLPPGPHGAIQSRDGHKNTGESVGIGLDSILEHGFKQCEGFEWGSGGAIDEGVVGEGVFGG